MVASSFKSPAGRKKAGHSVAPNRVKVSSKKASILELLKAGCSITEACERSAASYESFRYYRRTDEQFAAMVATILGEVREDLSTGRADVPDFPEFCEKWLGMKLWPHQLQWYDLLEGREPRDIHPSMTFEPGDPDMLVVNTPPGHAKSQTITIAYTTWQIVKNPSVAVVIVSKTQRLAMQFLLTIKNYLTNPQWERMQNRFGPPGGFAADSASWKQDQIYVSASLRDGTIKDPTVQALGIGGQLYGARSDLIILDDCVDNLNAADYEKQINWIQTEVASRLPDGGKILVVGTRLAPKDLYLELRNPERYGDNGEEGESPWTYFAQPAVLEFTDRVEDWVTLWPICDRPSGRHVKPDEEGYYTKWSGEVLHKRRSRMSPAAWARVYMQETVSEDSTFHPEHVAACVGGYSPGLLPDNPIGRPGGQAGLRILAGLDPAAVGFTAAVVYGVDVSSGKRWVLDVHNEAAMRPEAMKRLLVDWADKYAISEWRVERNAFQGFLTQDLEVRQALAARGCTLVEHTTGQNKNDEQLGVAAMEALFRNRMITLPRPQTEAVRAMVDQLGVWDADLARKKKIKTDVVMALWFAELRAQELVRTVSAANAFSRRGDHFHTRWETRSRSIVSAMDAEVAPVVSIWG